MPLFFSVIKIEPWGIGFFGFFSLRATSSSYFQVQFKCLILNDNLLCCVAVVKNKIWINKLYGTLEWLIFF